MRYCVPCPLDLKALTMSQRLKPLLWALTPMLLALLPSPAMAHVLHARHQLLPQNKIRVECYYSSSEPAVEAIVRVYRPNGELLLAAGVADDKGIYEFSWRNAEDLKVVVSQDGHRKELIITSHELADSGLTLFGQGIDESRRGFAELLAGVSFIMAAMALYLSIRNGARLRRMPGASCPAPETHHPAALPTDPAQR
jgi:hypothetical protein